MWPALGCAVLFLLPFAAAGVFAAVQMVRAGSSGHWGQAGLLAVFALVFGGVGLGGIATVLAGRRRVEEGLDRAARHPDAPWLWRPDWSGRRIPDSSRGGMRAAWAFALFWNLVSLPGTVLALRSALTERNHAALFALVFPVVGLGLLFWAVRATLRYRRFGATELELTTLPAPVGHALAGVVHTPAGLRPPDGFHVVLSCIRIVSTGAGRNRSTSETILWQDDRRVHVTGAGVPLAFAIPADAIPTDASQTGDRTLWRLEVSAEVPGVDYSAGFEVPVFRTPASDQPATDADLAAGAASAPGSTYRQPAGSRILVSVTRRGTEIYYSRARNPGMAAGLTAFLALWIGATWATIALDAPLVFPIVSGAFGLLIAIASLDAWLRVTRVTAGDGVVTVAGGWIAPGRERSLRAGEIAEVVTRIGSQAGAPPCYDVALVTAWGKRVAAGSGIRDKREAEWLTATLRAAIRPG